MPQYIVERQGLYLYAVQHVAGVRTWLAAIWLHHLGCWEANPMPASGNPLRVAITKLVVRPSLVNCSS